MGPQGVKGHEFGLKLLAKAIVRFRRVLEEALTGKGQIIGTLQYMSPEQLQGEDATPRSDLFSFRMRLV